MDFRLNIRDLRDPVNVEKLISTLSMLADELDNLVTTTAPNGNISARQGKIALYNNLGTYSTWINTDGGTTWQQISSEP